MYKNVGYDSEKEEKLCAFVTSIASSLCVSKLITLFQYFPECKIHLILKYLQN